MRVETDARWIGRGSASLFVTETVVQSPRCGVVAAGLDPNSRRPSKPVQSDVTSRGFIESNEGPPSGSA